MMLFFNPPAKLAGVDTVSPPRPIGGPVWCPVLAMLLAALAPGVARGQSETGSTPLPNSPASGSPVVAGLGTSPDQVTFTFQEAPWLEVLQLFADWSGLTLDLTATPPGALSYYDNRPHSPAEAIDILNGYLLPRGFVLLRRDQFLVCLATDDPLLGRLLPTVGPGELNDRGDNELVKVTVSAGELSPAAAAAEIEGLLGPYGKVTPLQSSGQLLLQGFGRGLRQAIDVLGDSRPPATDDKLDFRSYRIEHLPVDDVEQQIRNLFGIEGPGQAKNVSGARYEVARQRSYSDRGSRDRDDRDRRESPPPPLLQKVAMNMQVSSLRSANTLLVTATTEGLALVEEILKAIDLPTGRSAADLADANEPSLRVYGMTIADESEVAKTLDVLIPGVVVNEDRRQDTIHVFATPQQHREVDRLVRMLDISEGGSRTIEVIQLMRSDPAATAAFLNEMFSGGDREDRPSIQAELPSRSIVVRGTDNQIAEVRSALQKLGEPAQPGSAVDPPGGVRRIRLGNRSGRQIVEAAQRIFDAEDTQSPIRVVIPGSASPSSSVDRGDRSTGHEAARRPVPKTPQAAGRPPRTAQTPAVFASAVKKQPAAEPTGPGRRVLSSQTGSVENQPAGGPPVKVEVLDGELRLYSGDPQSLARVESVLRDLIRQMPGRDSWTIFYLRVAKADAGAAKLYELVAGSNPLPQPPGLSPLSSAAPDGLSLGEVTEPPLRIIPDARTNAIFVSGPEESVEQVGEFIEYIDATEVPGSFLNREPHAIPVRHADIEQVAELIRSLYKDYLVDPVAERLRAARSSRRGSRDDDEDDRRGGGGGSSAAAAAAEDSPGIRLTLAVDLQTGELLVACNDQLFGEIEAVVRQRDQAARDRQPTVEVIRVPESLPDNFLEMLEAVSPRVTAQAVTAQEADVRPSNSSRNDRRRSR